MLIDFALLIAGFLALNALVNVLFPEPKMLRISFPVYNPPSMDGLRIECTTCEALLYEFAPIRSDHWDTKHGVCAPCVGKHITVQKES